MRIILYISFLLMVSVDTGVAAGSSVAGKVSAGSSGNHLTIRIRNSTDKSVLGVRLKVVSRHDLLQNFIIKPAVIEKVAPGKSSVFDIFFAVDKDVEKDINEVVKFRVSAVEGRFKTSTAILNLNILADKENEESLPTGVVEEAVSPGKMERYIYALTKISVQDISYSDVSGTHQTEHVSGQLGYVMKYSNPVYTKVDQIRCVDCPTKIVLGESIHFKFDYRSRYDSEKFQCEEKTARDYWQPVLSFEGKNIEAVARGKPLHFPSCKELGLKGHETQNDPNSRVITAGAIVYDPVGLTLDESVSLTVDLRFTGDATDRDSVFYNDPTFSYVAEYKSDGKLFKEFRETEITVEYDDRKLKTTEHLKDNRIRFSINGMSLVYTLQVNGVPKPIEVSDSTVAPEFDKPPLNTVQMAGTGKVRDGKKQKTTGKSTAFSRGTVKNGPATKWPDTSGKRQKKSVASADVDPHDPGISLLIKDWLNHAEPPDNARGAKLRYDKWGRFYGTAADGGIITLNGPPANPVSPIPEVHVWAHRQMLDSINICTLEEYVIAGVEGKSLAHCLTKKVPGSGKVPDFVGFKAKMARKKLLADGYKVKLQAGKAAATSEEAFTVQEMDPKPGSQLNVGETIVVTVFTNPRKRTDADVPLPDLLGQKAQTAKKVLLAEGYQVKIEAGEPAPSVPRSFTVKSMRPIPGTPVARGSEVVLVVYVQAKKKIRLPDVAGLTNIEARKRLRRLGLRSTVAIQGNAPSLEKSFQVYGTEPPARTVVSASTTITIKAWGKFQRGRISVPDLSGMPIYKAIQKIKNQGLTVDYFRGKEAPEKSMVDTVFAQKPLPGAKVAPHSKVKVQYYGSYVWSGFTPDLRGLTIDEARQKLKKNNLLLRVSGKRDIAPTSFDVGKISKQTPQAGIRIRENDEIIVTFYGKTRRQQVADHSCTQLPNTEAFWDSSSKSPRCRCKPGYIVRADKRGCRLKPVVARKKPAVIKKKGKAGGREFILEKVVYSKYVADNDLCGQTMNCKRVKASSSGKTRELYYSISKVKAEFRFKEIYNHDSTILSDYQVKFFFDSPPRKISAGDTLQLHINAVAQGIISGWSYDRTFGYYLKNDGHSYYFKKQQVRISNRDLPVAGKGKPFKGKVTRNNTVFIKIPEKIKTLTIGAKHGWDPAIYVEWIYKPAGNQLPKKSSVRKKSAPDINKQSSGRVNCNRYENCFKALMQKTQNMFMQMMGGDASQYACRSLALNRELFRIAKNARSNGCSVNGNLEQSARLIEQTARQMCRGNKSLLNSDKLSECRNL